MTNSKSSTVFTTSTISTFLRGWHAPTSENQESQRLLYFQQVVPTLLWHSRVLTSCLWYSATLPLSLSMCLHHSHSLRFVTRRAKTIWASKMSSLFQLITVRSSLFTKFTHRLIAWRWLYVCAPAGPSISNCSWCVASFSAPERCALSWLEGRTECSVMGWVDAFWYHEGMTEKLGVLSDWKRFSLSLFHDYACWVAAFCESD